MGNPPNEPKPQRSKNRSRKKPEHSGHWKEKRARTTETGILNQMAHRKVPAKAQQDGSMGARWRGAPEGDRRSGGRESRNGSFKGSRERNKHERWEKSHGSLAPYEALCSLPRFLRPVTSNFSSMVNCGSLYPIPISPLWSPPTVLCPHRRSPAQTRVNKGLISYFTPRLNIF